MFPTTPFPKAVTHLKDLWSSTEKKKKEKKKQQ